MKKIILVVVLIAIIGVAWWALKDRQVDDGGTVKVGAIIFLTGPQASLGEEVRNALVLANELHNASSDRKIELIIEDSQDDPKVGISAYNRLKEQGVSAIISTGDQVSYALSPLANKDKIPLLMTVAASGEISGDYTFRSFITSENQAEVMGEYAAEDLDAKRIGVLYINNIFGESYLAQIEKTLAAREGSVVSAEAFDIVAPEMRTQITKVVAENPDAIVVAGFGPAYATSFNQLRQYGWQGDILTVNTLAVPFFFNAVAPANLHDIYLTDTNFDAAAPANPQTAEFVKNYSEKYQLDPSFIGAFAYDLYDILNSTVQSCGSTHKVIKDCLLDIKDKPGMLGEIDFSTHEMRVPFFVKKIEGGELTTVKAVE